MIPFVTLKQVMEREGEQLGYLLLGEEEGCVNGCCCGVSVYRSKEYGEAAAHEDQEGFYVLEGRGSALIAGEELLLEPGMSFVVPAKVEHVMKAAPESDACKVFWFHAAV